LWSVAVAIVGVVLSVLLVGCGCGCSCGCGSCPGVFDAGVRLLVSVSCVGFPTACMSAHGGCVFPSLQKDHQNSCRACPHLLFFLLSRHCMVRIKGISQTQTFFARYTRFLDPGSKSLLLRIMTGRTPKGGTVWQRMSRDRGCRCSFSFRFREMFPPVNSLFGKVPEVSRPTEFSRGRKG